jgi:anti-anti-sigma factor
MRIEIKTAGEYQVFCVEEDLCVISDLQELFYLVEGYIKQGITRFAVRFPNTSYIYSGAIAVLLKCIKKAEEDGGELCIIEPNPDIRNIFSLLGLDRAISILQSELELYPDEECGEGGSPTNAA